MRRSTCLALLGLSMLLGIACDNGNSLVSPAEVDPSGQWTVSQTVELNDCEVVNSPEGAEPVAGSPDGLGEMQADLATVVFNATIRVDDAGRLELVHLLSQVGDDPSPAAAAGCGVLVSGMLEGDQVRMSERETNSTPTGGTRGSIPGDAPCDVGWVRTTQLTFFETTFTGVTESVITSCHGSCTRRVSWAATRCDGCPEIGGDCVASGSGSNFGPPGRDVRVVYGS